MIHILLPAYNEEQALRPMTEKIDAVMREMGAAYRIVVVNDGSKDATGAILRELAQLYPIHAITHRYNRGLGETARDGFEHIAETAAPGDVVIRMDCDDTHDPRYIPAMVAKLREGYEVVTTSRYVPGGGQLGLDWYRRTISRCANLLLKFCFNIPGLKEYTCGYRAYRASLIQDAIEIFGNTFIDLKGMGFTGTIEKLIKCKMLGARVGEVPFVLRYDQKLSTSKVVTSLTALGYLVLIAKYVYPWGDLNRTWLERGRERRQRLYGPDNLLLKKEVSLDAAPEPVGRVP
jgi:dolichol-phosphate mannosyltransferase